MDYLWVWGNPIITSNPIIHPAWRAFLHNVVLLLLRTILIACWQKNPSLKFTLIGKFCYFLLQHCCMKRNLNTLWQSLTPNNRSRRRRGEWKPFLLHPPPPSKKKKMTNTIAIFVNITRGERKLGALIQQFLSGFCLEDWQRLLAAWGWWTEPRDRVVATCELLKWAEQQPACQWWSERWRRLQLESNQDEGLPCVWEELKQIYLKCLLKAKSKKKKRRL